MGLMAAKDVAEKWGISQRRVAILCGEGRIPGAQRVSNMWVIPDEAEKPADGRSLRYPKEKLPVVKPFAKWAGGKGQLLADIRKTYPVELGKSIRKYAEPFVGGGAVLFDILSSYELDAVYISDINAELMNTYRMIRDDVTGLNGLLSALQDKYLPMDDEARKIFYYEKRNRYNELKVNGDSAINLESAALFIFLNRTCFLQPHNFVFERQHTYPFYLFCVTDQNNADHRLIKHRNQYEDTLLQLPIDRFDF